MLKHSWMENLSPETIKAKLTEYKEYKSGFFGTWIQTYPDLKGVFEMEKSKGKELAEYITEQLAELESIRKTPMMGGYIFYYRERIFGGIYGAEFMVKNTEASRKYMPDSIARPPYGGAKEMLPVTIIDDRELLQKMVSEMFSELPERKPKARKSDNKQNIK